MRSKFFLVLLMFAIVKIYAMKEHQKIIKPGIYTAVQKDSLYTIIIKADSTFSYSKQVKFPVEFTYGKWRIKKNELILQTIADTLKFRSSHYSGQFIFFENEEYIINNSGIIEKNFAKKKYLYTQPKRQ